MRIRESKAPEGRPPAALIVSGLIVSGLIQSVVCGCSGPILSFRADPRPEVKQEAKQLAGQDLGDPASTGSIVKPPTSFGRDLGEEDWRRAHAALAVALDPQGNGRPVKWENPETALRGSVNPTGLPYVAGDEICRDFLASVVAPAASRFLRGTGCKPSGGTWELKRLKRAAKPAAT